MMYWSPNRRTSHCNPSSQSKSQSESSTERCPPDSHLRAVCHAKCMSNSSIIRVWGTGVRPFVFWIPTKFWKVYRRRPKRIYNELRRWTSTVQTRRAIKFQWPVLSDLCLKFFFCWPNIWSPLTDAKQLRVSDLGNRFYFSVFYIFKWAASIPYSVCRQSNSYDIHFFFLLLWMLPFVYYNCANNLSICRTVSLFINLMFSETEIYEEKKY